MNSTHLAVRSLSLLLLALFLITTAALTAPSSAAQSNLGAPLVVVNNAAVARTGDPVASGIAVPQWAGLYDATALRLLDSSGASVPVQFKVLSRWHGLRDDGQKPIKWLLVEFCANVPASSTQTYYLSAGAAGALGQLTTLDLANEVSVSTGAATFLVDKTAFNVLKRVTVGSTVVSSSAGSFDMTDSNGGAVTATLASTVIEEQGSVRTVVRQRGTLSLGGLAFTARYFFWTGRKDVQIDFRLENNQSYGMPPNMGTVAHNAYFDQLSLSVRLNGTGSTVTTSSGNYLTAGSAFDLRQVWAEPGNLLQMLNGCAYTESVLGLPVNAGSRHAGAVSFTTGSRSIAAFVDRFWQNFPKGVKASGNKLSVSLWPSFGSGPLFTGQFGVPLIGIDPMALLNYRFEGGRWKTYSTTFSFKTGSGFSQSELADTAAKIANPLMCRLQDLSVPFIANAFGQLVTHRSAWNDTAKDRYERIMDVMVKDSAADNQPSLGQLGFPGFRNRGGTYGGQQFYGWENFGDIPWGDGYSSLHYDHNWGVLINWYRTGDYAFFDIGRDMAAHRRDYDQYHSRDSQDNSRGGQFYEKGYFHGNFGEPEQSHTWVGGMLLYYAMTGDEGSREAAMEAYGFIQRHHPEQWDGWWGARIPGWNLENLVDLYNYIGDPAYKNLAAATAAQWGVVELQHGGGGYVLNPGYGPGNEHAEVWMHSIVMNALAKYYLIEADPAVLPAINRMATWLVNDGIANVPSGPMTARGVAKVWTDWTPTSQTGASIHHCWGVIEALSNAALCTQNVNYFNMAGLLWESTTRYYQGTQTSGGQNYNSATTFCPIAYRMMGYPNSESKIMSNIAKWGHAYLTLSRHFNAAFP
jgi:hypothetical protein